MTTNEIPAQLVTRYADAVARGTREGYTRQVSAALTRIAKAAAKATGESNWHVAEVALQRAAGLAN